ncbi:TRAP transporter large permease [Salibacterium lacus]|uniref:TRAP transporter large permease n=1 Tax=Salibacterium lacus TaxID=1898109 RepID=A0ABW5T639_9BACI
MTTALAATLLFGSLIVLLLIGTPIALATALSAIFTMLWILPFDQSLTTAAQQLAVGVDNFTILSIPLFVLAGIIMNNGGIAFKLINLAKLFVGRLPGTLAHTNVVGNMLFGSISGSSVAAAAAMGKIITPMAKRQNYPVNYIASANIASAPAGLLIPPSSMLIVYSLVSGGTSIAALFIAGYIPGILWGLVVMTIAYFIAKRNGYAVSEKISWKDKTFIVLDAVPSLLLIVLVIGGIVGGVFTATEGAAVAVVYATVLSLIYREISIKQIDVIFKETFEVTGMILFLIISSSLFSLMMSYLEIPSGISNVMLSISDNPIIILLIMNLLLLFMGTFMDVTPAILIFTPIFFPVAADLGVDPVHFGIIIAFNLCIGSITPPIGSVLFVGTSVAKANFEKVIKTLVPYFVILIVMLLIITFFPQLSLFLPDLFGLL